VNKVGKKGDTHIAFLPKKNFGCNNTVLAKLKIQMRKKADI
jgi:hypothetical protein